MAKTEKKLSQILAETFEKYLYAEGKPVDTLIDFDRVKDVLPIPTVNGDDSVERTLTDANKEELLKMVQETYISKDYGKLMDFLSYAFPISYSNKGETITTMYNALRKQLKKSESYELTYNDMTKIFETGKPLESFDKDAASFTNQVLKKGRKSNILSKEDKLRFLIQGYKVARYFENHTEDMDHFRDMQSHFYKNNKKGVSAIDTDMLKDLLEAGFSSDEVLLLRQSFYKGGSKDNETYELISSDVVKPSSALDSIEMKNVVEADNVLRSIFVGKYVKERLADKKAALSYYTLEENDQKIFASFMTPDMENIDNVFGTNVDMYANGINSLVNKLFREKYDIVKYKPYLKSSKEDGWELEEYSDKEYAAHKKTIRDAIVKSAIANGAFVCDSKEEFMKRLAIACTDKEVTKHFSHAGMNAIARDEENNFIDFESTFPDAANAPYATQNRKCGTATINYEGTLYYVTGVPVVATGNTADNVVDDEWALSITDQELNALIVNLTNKYGISFGNLTRENFTVGKNMAAFEASKMALGKDAKIGIETAFEMAKKKADAHVEEEEENPYVNHEDTVKDFTSYKDTAAYKEAYNKAMAEYKKQDSLIELIAAILPKVVEALQGNFSHVYSDKDATLENAVRAAKEARADHLEAEAIIEEADDEAAAKPTSEAPYKRDVETLHPEEKHRDNEVIEEKSTAKAHNVKWEKGKNCIIVDGKKLELVGGSRLKDLSNHGHYLDYKKTLEYLEIIQESGIDITEIGFAADSIEKIRNIVNDGKSSIVLPTGGLVKPLEITDEDLNNIDLTIDDDEVSRLLNDYELFSDGHWEKSARGQVSNKAETTTTSSAKTTRTRKATVKKTSVQKSVTASKEEIKPDEVSIYQLNNSTNIELNGKNYFVMKGIIYDSNFKEVSQEESEKVKAALENNVQPELPWKTGDETIPF